MSELPRENQVTQEDLTKWYNMADQLKKLKFTESLLRKRIFKFFFPNAKEGSNNHEMEDGYTLHADYPYTRDVDEAALNKSKTEMRKAGINVDTVFKYKPVLAKSVYNKLTAEQKALVDAVIITKPGSPTMSIKMGAALRKRLAEAGEVVDETSEESSNEE